MTKKSLAEAAKKLRKIYPDVYTAVEYNVVYDMHPKSKPKLTQHCSIYTALLGHFRGATFEACFAQL